MNFTPVLKRGPVSATASYRSPTSSKWAAHQPLNPGCVLIWASCHCGPLRLAVPVSANETMPDLSTRFNCVCLRLPDLSTRFNCICLHMLNVSTRFNCICLHMLNLSTRFNCLCLHMLNLSTRFNFVCLHIYSFQLCLSLYARLIHSFQLCLSSYPLVSTVPVFICQTYPLVSTVAIEFISIGCESMLFNVLAWTLDKSTSLIDIYVTLKNIIQLLNLHPRNI